VQARRAKPREAGSGVAIDVEPVILALKKQRSVGPGGLDTLDLRAGDVCDGAGRYQGGRIDAQLRAIGKCQRFRFGDLVVRRYQHKSGVFTEVTRVVGAAHAWPATRATVPRPYCKIQFAGG
jgi:hypothetical protein